MGDLDSIPGLGRSPGEGKGYPIQYSGSSAVHISVNGVDKTDEDANSDDAEKRPLSLFPASSEML